ncbi:hypothetical protein [Pareuzebyella sediminis]|uniref:hypothetical protein n=1 Tax=Pareuzebyella sediminis TaxID=2607998 RepID=UPI0011EC7F32|nr:hypothetical protein [Pareuzebyella sediminis]
MTVYGIFRGTTRYRSAKPFGRKERGTFAIKKLYQATARVPLTFGKANILNEEAGQREVGPTAALSSAYYRYIVGKLKEKIEDRALVHLYRFEEDRFGLEGPELRKVALNHYRQGAEDASRHSADLVEKGLSPQGNLELRTSGKIGRLLLKKETMPLNLAKFHKDGLEAYLMGKGLEVDGNVLKKNPVLQEIIDLEAALIFLSRLNERFGLEKEVALRPSEVDGKENTEVPATKKRSKKKTSVLTDSDALDYLLDTVFGKKRNG